jgi:hypothetical protein
MSEKRPQRVKKAAPANRRKQDPLRDPETNRFLPGHSGNPSGRPKGPSITKALLAALETKPKGSRITYLEAVIQKIITKIVVDGDSHLIGKFWDHIDGKPKQQINHQEDSMMILIHKRPEVKEP